MSKKKSTIFLERLLDELSADVLESEGALQAELSRMGARATRMIEHLQTFGSNAIARQRRARLQENAARASSTRSTDVLAKYLTLGRDEIIEKLRSLSNAAPSHFAVQHRDLNEMPIADLRSLLEDAEAVHQRSEDDAPEE